MKISGTLFYTLILILTTLTFYSCKDTAVKPVEENQLNFIKAIGGPLSERAAAVFQSPGGGIFAAGFTISYGSGGNDGFALKLDNSGNILWCKVFGGSANDQINGACPVTDGGYIMVGETVSFGSSASDIYVVKLDPSGNLMWSKFYRITGNDYGTSITQTADYGFLISGFADGFGSGASDALVMKINFTGDLLWVNVYGGIYNDYGSSIKAFDDNSSILAGYTFSGGAGNGDISLIRLDPNGVAAWTKYYGGTELEQPYNVEITNDNGYIVCGTTYSFGLSSGDEYFIKTDGNGFIYWSRTFGGGGLDQALSVTETADGQYISGGETGSYGSGQGDAFVVKLFGDGNFNYAKTLGGTGSDIFYSAGNRSNTGYIFAGYTQSFGASNNDIFIVTMKEDGAACTNNNPVIPGGGSPSTILNEAAIFSSHIGTYETVEAGTMLSNETPVIHTVCSQ